MVARLRNIDSKIRTAEAEVIANRRTIEQLKPQLEECEETALEQFGVKVGDLPEYIEKLDAEIEEGVSALEQALSGGEVE